MAVPSQRITHGRSVQCGCQTRSPPGTQLCSPLYHQRLPTVPFWTRATLARKPLRHVQGRAGGRHWAECWSTVLGHGLWVRLSPVWLSRPSLSRSVPVAWRHVGLAGTERTREGDSPWCGACRVLGTLLCPSHPWTVVRLGRCGRGVPWQGPWVRWLRLSGLLVGQLQGLRPWRPRNQWLLHGHLRSPALRLRMWEELGSREAVSRVPGLPAGPQVTWGARLTASSSAR